MIYIAIIDDDKTFCDDFKEQIKKIDNSYNTDCYYDINPFLESVSSYNIAIIDIMLGKDNGIDIASAITEKYPNIKIIFISVEQDFFSRRLFRQSFILFGKTNIEWTVKTSLVSLLQWNK